MDSIANFLNGIKNSGAAGHEKVDLLSSNMNVALAELLLKNNLIRSYKVAKDSKQGIIRIYLKYQDNGKHAIEVISRVSTPGRRVYVNTNQIPQVRSGRGVVVLSTNKGLLTGKDAKQMNLGGEIICKVW